MKYLKTYENKNNELWVVTQISNISPDDFDVYIFDDEQSAKNYMIDLVNDLVKQESYSDKDQVFTFEDIEEFENQITYRVSYNKYKNYGKYELPENLKVGANVKKYNL